MILLKPNYFKKQYSSSSFLITWRSKWPWSTSKACPMSFKNETSHFVPVYLLRVSKNEYEEYIILKWFGFRDLWFGNGLFFPKCLIGINIRLQSLNLIISGNFSLALVWVDSSVALHLNICFVGGLECQEPWLSHDNTSYIQDNRHALRCLIISIGIILNT